MGGTAVVDGDEPGVEEPGDEESVWPTAATAGMNTTPTTSSRTATRRFRIAPTLYQKKAVGWVARTHPTARTTRL